jgi:hypothetical protein
MNKIKNVNINLWNDNIINEWNKSKINLSYDCWLTEVYGISQISTHREIYPDGITIIDESKFNLFILKYSEYIREIISYE